MFKMQNFVFMCICRSFKFQLEMNDQNTNVLQMMLNSSL